MARGPHASLATKVSEPVSKGKGHRRGVPEYRNIQKLTGGSKKWPMQNSGVSAESGISQIAWLRHCLPGLQVSSRTLAEAARAQYGRKITRSIRRGGHHRPLTLQQAVWDYY
jgi:hypothetical protein